MYRQGDVLLRRVKKPKKYALERYREVKNGIVLRGEKTNHAHRIVDGEVLTTWNQMVVVANHKTRLVHEEHGTIQIREGVYEVVRQREFDSFDRQRFVMD